MLTSALIDRCRAQPHAIAVTDGQQETTYGELLDVARGWAAQWQSLPGFEPGGIVAIQLPNRGEYAAAVLAVHWLGAAVLPVNTQWKPEEVVRHLDGLPVVAVISDGPRLHAWNQSNAWQHVSRLDIDQRPPQITAAGQARLEALLQTDHSHADALLLMTSGSSGRAKVVVRTQANLLANARHVGQELNWQPGGRILPVTPFFHANGFSNGMLLPLLAGCRIVLLRQFFPATLVALMERESVQVVIGSPVVYETLLRYDMPPAACQALQYAISSGAPLGPSVAGEFFDRWGIRVRELYGTSETGTIAIEPITPPQGDKTAGRPLPGVEVAVLSDTGSPVAAGETGAIAVRSPAVMKGYWTGTGVDAARNPDGYYLTGDLGRLDEQGQVRLCGRSSRFLNIGGNKVSPGEVEEVLRALPGVVRCRVEAEGTPPQIQATLWSPTGVVLTQSDLLAHCRGQLAEYKIPRRFVFEQVRAADLPDKHTVILPGST